MALVAKMIVLLPLVWAAVHTYTSRMEYGHASVAIEVPRQLSRAVELFVGILSVPHGSRTREAIRASWVRQPGNWSYAFIVGRSDVDEVDVAVLDVEEAYSRADGYSSLPTKVVAMYWLGSQAKFIAKADDDTYVYPHVALAFIAKLPTPFYGGEPCWQSKALRKGPWGVPRTRYAGPQYPVYAQGGGYLVSGDLAQCFLGYDLTAMPMEDVMTGLYATVCGVHPKNIWTVVANCKGQASDPACRATDCEPQHTSCIKDRDRPLVFMHGVSPEQMIAMANNSWRQESTKDDAG